MGYYVGGSDPHVFPITPHHRLQSFPPIYTMHLAAGKIPRKNQEASLPPNLPLGA